MQRLCLELLHNSRRYTTRQVEWARHRASYPYGYGYSQFCTLYARWCKENHQVVQITCYYMLLQVFFSKIRDRSICVWLNRVAYEGAGGAVLCLKANGVRG